MTPGRRLLVIEALLVLVGALVAASWVVSTGGPPALRDLARLRPAHVPVLLALTGACLSLRFVRWQYLLRRSGLRVPTRASLSIYLASLAGIATPAYAGEILRGAFLRRRFGVSLNASATIIVLERLLDGAALALLGLAATGPGWERQAIGGALAVLLLVGVGLRRLAVPLGAPAATVARLVRAGPLATALVLSLAAWLPASLLVSGSARALGERVPPEASLRIFTTSTLLGAATLMPAGVGATGSLAIGQLRDSGMGERQSVTTVTCMRLFSTGVALGVSAAFLLFEVRRRPAERPHFEVLAGHYRDELPAHVWDYLLVRKTEMIADSLPAPPAAGRGLDLGCGLGEQAGMLSRRGFSVVGLDAALPLAVRARRQGLTVVAASALALPFRPESLGFVYAVGVLHHLAPQGQQRACAEAGRALRPGGRLLVHESNPRNPIFRFYMGYLFPLLRAIDEGTETWIDPRDWARVPGFHVLATRYFTFLPDFLPRSVMRAFVPLQRLLEGSALQRYAAHYLASLVKAPSDPETETPGTAERAGGESLAPGS